MIATSQVPWASLIAQLVKNLPVMQETLVRFLGQEDPLEKGYPLQYSQAFLVFQLVKNLSTMSETWLKQEAAATAIASRTMKSLPQSAPVKECPELYVHPHITQLQIKASHGCFQLV